MQHDFVCCQFEQRENLTLFVKYLPLVEPTVIEIILIVGFGLIEEGY